MFQVQLEQHSALFHGQILQGEFLEDLTIITCVVPFSFEQEISIFGLRRDFIKKLLGPANRCDFGYSFLFEICHGKEELRSE